MQQSDEHANPPLMYLVVCCIFVCICVCISMCFIVYLLYYCGLTRAAEISRASAYLRPDKHANVLIPDLRLNGKYEGPHKMVPIKF